MAYPHIVVRAYPVHVTHSKDPYQFQYDIEIENHGPGAARLLRRRWIITDANGKVIEVTGPGVVGEQPTIEANAIFRYQSMASLPTPVGVMEGSYTLEDEQGRLFDVSIAPFTLAIANIIN